MNPIHHHRLDNGLTLLVEPMADVASVGMTLLLPAGACTEPQQQHGVGAVLSEMLFRGAGGMDARAHCQAMDLLGIKRSAEVHTYHTRIGGIFLGRRIEQALPLLADLALRPALPDSALQPCRELALQAIDALEDEPQQRVIEELRRAHFGPVLGRSTLGDRRTIGALTLEQVRHHHAVRFVPGSSILALAGAVDFDTARQMAEQLLGDTGDSAPLPDDHAQPGGGYKHVPADTTQQHIALAYPTVPLNHPDAMTQRLAVAVLSGGMSGRLFTEVREKRGLCYAVFASYSSLLNRGSVFAYAGTTTARAPDTLAVLQRELQRLSDGAKEDEFERARIGLKSRLVMQGESTSARAAAIASDQFLLGRPRSLDEIEEEIDAVSLDALNAFLAAHRPEQFTVLSIGPEPLEVD